MRYEAPATSRDAAAILAKSKETAFVLGGGTDVLVKMRTGLIEPDLLVDIKAIPAMKEIKVSDKGFGIGAAVSGAELSEHKLLRKHLPGLVEAANLIGSIQTLTLSSLKPPTKILPTFGTLENASIRYLSA